MRTAIACALAQEDVDVHVVVVDDGSTDATACELRALEEDARVRVLRHARPKGVAAARNLGLAHARAPWVAFLDDDDIWAPGHLASMLQAISRSELDPRRVGLVFSGHLAVDGGWNVTYAVPPPSVQDAREGIYSFNSIGCPSRVLARTEAVREVGGFDESLSVLADWDLWARVVARYDLVRSPEMFVGYMIHGANMHTDAEQLLDELEMVQGKLGWGTRGSRASTRAARAGDMVPSYVAASYRAVAGAYRARGRRVRSAAWYLRSYWVGRDRRDVLRAVGVLLGERATELSGLREYQAADPSLVGWVEYVRQASQATVGMPALDGICGDRAEAR